MKQLKMLLLTSIVTLFTTYAHAVPVNMAPIITYLLSDTQQFSLAGKTKYFATSRGATGYRVYNVDGTYTSSLIFSDGTTLDTNGTYNIVGDVLTLNQISPVPAILELTYLGEETGGLYFDVTINGGEPFQSVSFDSADERDIYVAEFLSTLIEGETKYFATSLGVTGYRTYGVDGNYTGSLTLANGNTFDTNGTYVIEDYVMTIDRTSPTPKTLELTYVGEKAGGLAFLVTDGENSFLSVSFDSAEERDAYVLSTLIVGKTKYFATSLGATGVRTYGVDGNYAGSLTLANGYTFDTNGTYDINGSVVTLERTSPEEVTLILTYLGQESGGSEFNVTIGDGDPFQSVSFDSAEERDAFVKSFTSDVMPIFIANCKSCHGTSGSKTFKIGDAEFTYNNIINNFLINTLDPDLSPILINGNGGDLHSVGSNPPGDRLLDPESAVIRDWIWQGGLYN